MVKKFWWFNFGRFQVFPELLNFQQGLISSFRPVQYIFLWHAMRMCKINFGTFSGSEINEY